MFAVLLNNLRYCCDGALEDVLTDNRIKLDQNFKNSFIGEIIKVCILCGRTKVTQCKQLVLRYVDDLRRADLTFYNWLSSTLFDTVSS